MTGNGPAGARLGCPVPHGGVRGDSWVVTPNCDQSGATHNHRRRCGVSPAADYFFIMGDSDPREPVLDRPVGAEYAPRL